MRAHRPGRTLQAINSGGVVLAGLGIWMEGYAWWDTIVRLAFRGDAGGSCIAPFCEQFRLRRFASAIDFAEDVVHVRDIALACFVQHDVEATFCARITVVLSATNLRRVLHRIAMHRCVSVHEWRPDQKRPAKGEPVIQRIDFIDLTKPVPKAVKAN